MKYPKFAICLIAFGVTGNAITNRDLITAKNKQADAVKEIQLVVENNKPNYPVNVHYQFYSDKTVYAEGNLSNIAPNEKQFVYVNRVPAENSVVIQLDKINVANRTVFNDPCEVQLKKDQLTAKISVGFEGDANTHASSFTCEVSPYQQ